MSVPQQCVAAVGAIIAGCLSVFGPLIESANSQTLDLPPRPSDALTGTEFATRVNSLPLPEREQEVFDQVTAGNVPNFLRKLCPVTATNVFEGKTNSAVFYVTPDYLAVGSDDDYFLMPVSPNTAQRIADALHCSLPTPKMVDEIYAAAEVKLAPAPIPPSPAMTTVPVFSNHNAIVRAQRAEQLQAHPLGALVAGHQKDVVISAKLVSAPRKVAIYGWQRTNGVPIQPLYLKHTAAWVDYSQCTRLVQQKMTVNGASTTVAQVLADPALAGLLSNEGPIPNPRYPTNALPQLPLRGRSLSLAGWSLHLGAAKARCANQTGSSPQGTVSSTNRRAWWTVPQFSERVASFTFEPGVKVRVNAPGESSFTPGKKCS